MAACTVSGELLLASSAALRRMFFLTVSITYSDSGDPAGQALCFG